MLFPAIAGPEPANPYDTKTIDQVLGTTRRKIISWLESHEHDGYYIGTPYEYVESNYSHWNEAYCTRPRGEYSVNPILNCSSGRQLERNRNGSGTTVSDGITISWDPVPGAAAYRVYRKVSGGSWKGIITVNSTVTSYQDTPSDFTTAYLYTVRAYGHHCSRIRKNRRSQKTGKIGRGLRYPLKRSII